MSTYTPKNILVTGAAGFIGSHVANRIIRNYPAYRIVVLDKLDYCSSLKNLYHSQPSPNFKFVKDDISGADFVKHLLVTEKIDTIMHFAAQTRVDNSFENSFAFTKNNVYGTHVLLEASKVTGQIRRFIHFSTDEVYGEADEDAVVGYNEAFQLLPTNPYSATKAAAEMLVMDYGRSYGLPVITTRGNNVYGPNQFPENLIPKFMLLAMRGKTLPIHGDGSNVRSYLYCEDVAEAFETILHKGVVGHVYSIGTKKERRVIDVAKDICKLFNMDTESSFEFVDNRPFSDRRYILDDQKLKNLGWSERTTWEDGLKKTMEWYTMNIDWWGDVSGALLLHPRMLVMLDESSSNGIGTCEAAAFSINQSPMIEQAGSKRIISQKPPLKFLIYGRTCWIGGLLGQLCEKQGIPFEYGKGCLEESSSLIADIKNVEPTHVFNAADVTGRPNVDGCETPRIDTIRANVEGTLTLANVCEDYGLPMMNFATGCIFVYDAAHPMGSGIGLKEGDEPSFDRSFYSKIKAIVEGFLQDYDNVCTLTHRMPISSEFNSPRVFITKMTGSDELLPVSIEMAKRNLRGVWNFTSPMTKPMTKIGSFASISLLFRSPKRSPNVARFLHHRMSFPTLTYSRRIPRYLPVANEPLSVHLAFPYHEVPQPQQNPDLLHLPIPIPLPLFMPDFQAFVEAEQVAMPEFQAEAEQAAIPEFQGEAEQAAMPEFQGEAEQAAMPEIQAETEQAAMPEIEAEAEQAAMPEFQAEAEQAAIPEFHERLIAIDEKLMNILEKLESPYDDTVYNMVKSNVDRASGDILQGLFPIGAASALFSLITAGALGVGYWKAKPYIELGLNTVDRAKNGPFGRFLRFLIRSDRS